MFYILIVVTTLIKIHCYTLKIGNFILHKVYLNKNYFYKALGQKNRLPTK